MNILDKIKKMFTSKTVVVKSDDYELSNSLATRTFDYYKANEFENGFSSIRAIANAFLQVRPYATDVNNKKIKANAVDKLYHPNKSMSSAEFREALAIMALVHPKVYILHWHYEDGKLVAGGEVTEENIAGYTFLEGVEEQKVGSTIEYKYGTQTYTKQDLLIIKSINPYDLSKGYSPAQAAHKWTKLDDYIAEYQAGFFENGAIPNGMFIIRAKTVQDFRDIKTNMELKHRGAGKNGNVTYSYQPLDETGQAKSSQIEWVPFNVPSKDMALKELFDEANQKIDSAYGVPASIRGVNNNNTYASVRVDEVIMAKYTVAPFLMKIWNRFTHELNRVTGGLGYSITYDYEIPEVADEELVKANVRVSETQAMANIANAINLLSISGFSTMSIVEALQLPESYKLLAEKPKEVVEEDNQDVDEGDEVEDTPEQPLKGEAVKSLKAKKLTAVDRKQYENKLNKVVEKYTELQVDRAIATLDIEIKSKAYGDSTETQDKDFADELLFALTPLINKYGNKTHDLGVKLLLEAGLNTEHIAEFNMTDDEKIAYRGYLNEVATSYDIDTAEKIRQVLDDGITNGQTAADIKRNLKETLTGEANKYRVERLSKTEVNLAEGKASNLAMEQIQTQTGVRIYKQWNTSGVNPCEYCQAMAGHETLLTENFVNINETVVGIDGGTYIPDFKDTDTASLHPNCNCYETYRVERV